MKFEVTVSEEDLAAALQRRVRQAVADSGVISDRGFETMITQEFRSIAEKAVAKLWTDHFQAKLESRMTEIAEDVLKRIISERLKK